MGVCAKGLDLAASKVLLLGHARLTAGDTAFRMPGFMWALAGKMIGWAS
jgi:hypothetical protein